MRDDWSCNGDRCDTPNTSRLSRSIPSIRVGERLKGKGEGSFPPPFPFNLSPLTEKYCGQAGVLDDGSLEFW